MGPYLPLRVGLVAEDFDRNPSSPRPQEAPPRSAPTDRTAVARGASGRLCVSLFELPRNVSCLEATVKLIGRLKETWRHGVLRDERHQVHPLRLQPGLRGE